MQSSHHDTLGDALRIYLNDALEVESFLFPSEDHENTTKLCNFVCKRPLLLHVLLDDLGSTKPSMHANILVLRQMKVVRQNCTALKKDVKESEKFTVDRVVRNFLFNELQTTEGRTSTRETSREL